MSTTVSNDRLKILTPDEAELIWRLRLAVVRAAQPDSLYWWDDRSLTPDAEFVTERLFSRRPQLAAARIALATALVRHRAAIPAVSRLIHLFDFGDEIEYELEAVKLTEAWLPSSFQTANALLDFVGQIVPDDSGYSCEIDGTLDTHTGPLEIWLALDNDPRLKRIVAEASALTLAYATGGLQRPVFPYLRRKR